MQNYCCQLMFASLRSKLLGSPKVPTLMHVTHAKAGSTWIANVLRTLFTNRVAPRGPLVAKASGGDISKHHFEAGWIYPAMFMTRGEFLAHAELSDAKRFVVIRDPRDTLVSLYFSLKYSHPLDETGQKKKEREMLQSLSVEEGLAHLLEHQLARVAAIQSSWLGTGELVLRYEDLLEDQTLLSDLLLNKLQLPTTPAALARALEKNKFESVFKRKLGEVDEASHGRQGLPGDWKNHFTPALRRRFHEKHGAALIAAGYEKDESWTA